MTTPTTPGSVASLDTMAAALTPRYDRGLERLRLGWGATTAGTTAVAAYDFGGYSARHGRLPDRPAYLLVPHAPATTDGVARVWYRREAGAGEESVTLDVPAGWAAGRPLAVPLPGAAAAVTPELRITRVALPGGDSGAWTVVALLGTLARLLWVIGAAHEEVRAQALDVAAQADAATARAAGLDLLGSDLGVVRFPPRSHSWDEHTIALWHLDDRRAAGASDVVTVADEGSRYGGPGHPGTNGPAPAPLATPGRPGRFGGAFGFGGGRQVTVPHHAALDLAAGASCTVEALVAPTRGGDGGVALAKAAPSAAGAGWSLSVGAFLGVAGNCRFAIGDGTRTAVLHGDRDLRDGRFHHVAATVDGAATPPVVRLYLDGLEVAAAVAPTGPVATAGPLLFGTGREVGGAAAAPRPYDGLLDEVRISAVARSDFTPVLGEGDAEYRRRLEVFQRWRLPTPGGIAAALNELVGPIGGEPEPIVVQERVAATPSGTATVRVLPDRLLVGQSLTAEGDPRATEAEAAGADDEGSDPAWLLPCPDAPGLAFADAAARLMHPAAREALTALLAGLGGGGVLTVRSAADPVSSSPVVAAGRRLVLSHAPLRPEDLAVAAHLAGFARVAHAVDGTVHATVAPGAVLRITLPGWSPAVESTPEVTEGGTLPLRVEPSPAALTGGEVRWSVVRPGAGTARLDITPGVTPDALLRADTAGEVVVQVEITRRHLTARGARRIRIGLADTSLAAGQRIDAQGRRAAAASVPGPPGAELPDSLLVNRDDDLDGAAPGAPAVGYASLAARRMHPEAARFLDRLLRELTPAPGALRVERALAPGSALAAAGRVLELTHTTLPAAALAARAFAAGCPFLEVTAVSRVRVVVGDGEAVTVLAPDRITAGRSDEPGAYAPVGLAPRAEGVAVRVSPDGAHAYVADRAGSRILRFALAARSPGGPPLPVFDRSAAVAPLPEALAVTAGHVLALHPRAEQLSVWTRDLAPVAVVGGVRNAVGLAVAGGRVFVAGNGGELTAHDPGTGAVVAGPLPLPGAPVAVAATADGTALVVALLGDTVVRVDAATLVLTHGPVATGAGVTDLAGAGAEVYVACAEDAPGATGTLRVHRAADLVPVTVVAGFAPGHRPRRVAAAADGSRVFVATSGEGTTAGQAEVRIVDAAARVLLGPALRPGGDALALTVTPSAASYAPSLAVLAPVSGTLQTADLGPLAATPPRDPFTAGAARLGAGGGEEISWSLVTLGRAAAELGSFDAPSSSVRGLRPGTVLVRAQYLPADGARPYQFAVRLNPALEARADVRLRKDQYDLVMNALVRFCPIGVEVRTDRLRTRVVELATPDDLVPGYTFPVFRRRGPVRDPRTGDA